MLNQFSGTQLLLGREALVRSGIGAFDLIDDDKVCLTNLKRQIKAIRKMVGKYKADVMKERMEEIYPDVEMTVHKCFFLPAKKKQVPVISCMDAGNKLDAGAFRVVDIYKTKMCPLAKVMRRELKNEV